MTLYGYARVSVREPEDKNLDLQVERLVRAGCAMGNIRAEEDSGAKNDRGGLLDLLDLVVEGDTLVVIDGKTLRGSMPAGRSRGVHLMAAYLPGEGVVLAQVEVEGKEHEIKAASRLLEAIDLRGKVVSGDAMLAQRQLSAQIVESGENTSGPSSRTSPNCDGIAAIFKGGAAWETGNRESGSAAKLDKGMVVSSSGF